MNSSRFIAFPQAGPSPAPPPGQSWEKLMKLALAQAERAKNAGEIPVGALVVDPYGEILGVAHNEVEKLHDPTAHAEILAIRKACLKLGNCRLENCCLICTLEPCVMCGGALSHARLAGLVYGACDPACGAISSAADFWDLPGSSRKLWHMGGVLSETCATVLHDFFQSRR